MELPSSKRFLISIKLYGKKDYRYWNFWRQRTERCDKKSIVAGVSGVLDVKEKAGELPIPGEQEKTERDILRVETVREFLGKLFERLNLPQEQCFIEPNQIHFLSKEAFEENFAHMESGVGGFFRVGDRAIFMNEAMLPGDEPVDEELLKLSDLSHESIHLASHSKTLANARPDHTVSFGNYRTGYQIVNVGEDDSKFKGFNEGVVCVTDRLMLSGEAEEIKKRFNLTDEQMQKVGLNAYVQNQMLVHIINAKIAEYRKENPSTSMTRIVRGQFTGDMMHLRDVEDIYGKGSLDLLSKYQSSSDPELNERRDALIFEYFGSENPEERVGLKEKILEAKSIAPEM